MSNNLTIIGLVGRTNSGKSTLLNNFVGKKISAVANKVNTTRVPLTGVYRSSLSSFLIFDAPGVCQIQTVLDRFIFQNILKIVEKSDLIWWCIDNNDQWKKDNQILADILIKTSKPVFLLINKIDLINKEILLTKINFFQKKFNFTEIIPISAKNKINFANLAKVSQNYAQTTTKPISKNFFSLNNFSDIAKEVIREQIVNQTNDEVPHQTALLLEGYQSNKQSINMMFILFVSTRSQKAIILGKNGGKIKSIREKSQGILNKLWKKKILIFLQVKVQKNWFQDINLLKKLGMDWIGND